MHARTTLVAIGIALTAAAHAHGQSNISPVNRFTWCENAGFINWRDAAGGTGGVRVLENAGYLRGFAWSENMGYLNLGNGGGPYANTTGLNFGVNLNPATGLLSGFGWSENAGWVNFSGGELATPPNPARFDIASRRFRGYAWSENAGWINLDHGNVFVGVLCPADFNRDGVVNSADFFDFLAAFFTNAPAADFNIDGSITSQDFFDFLAAFFSGC